MTYGLPCCFEDPRLCAYCIGDAESCHGDYICEIIGQILEESKIADSNVAPNLASDGFAGTNWEKWFGSPKRAAESVSRLVDRFDAMCRDESFHSPFTDCFAVGGECEFGLIHQSTLRGWLERKCSDVSVEVVGAKARAESDDSRLTELENLLSGMWSSVSSYEGCFRCVYRGKECRGHGCYIRKRMQSLGVEPMDCQDSDDAHIDTESR